MCVSPEDPQIKHPRIPTFSFPVCWSCSVGFFTRLEFLIDVLSGYLDHYSNPLTENKWNLRSGDVKVAKCAKKLLRGVIVKLPVSLFVHFRYYYFYI